MGTLALYFFAKYHCEGYPFPLVEEMTQKAWLNKYLFFTSSETRPMHYSTEYDAMRAAFQACDIASHKFTHASRASGADAAESRGASELSIRRLGNWVNTVAEAVYMSKFPVQALKAQGGFHVHTEEIFYDRDNVSVPEVLWRQVFPEIEGKLEALSSASNPSISGKNYLEALRFLSKVLLQDAPFLIQQYPDFFCWKKPIFQRYSFCNYSF